MSTEFIPGQNARAIRTTQSASGVGVVKNAEVTVEAYFGGSQFMARLEAEDGLILSTDDFEPVPPPEPYPATPAPLDPTAVKAGDTVTVDVKPLHGPRYSLSGEVYRVDTSGLLWVGPVCITLPAEDIVKVTLTDHQPAPEPEPEWKPGTVVEATVNGGPVRGFVGREPGSGDGPVFVYWNEFAGHVSLTGTVPTDVRPLAVIDPAEVDVESVAAVLYQAVKRAKSAGFSWNEVVRATLAEVGIEVAR